MMTIRKADDRGHANFGWLDSRHTFSFGSYYDADHMGYGLLRVINDDRVAPARGFDMHGHKDMEIITYVLAGALAHKDSLGTGSVIHPGDVQIMSAGTGIRHSEFNGSEADPVHLLQVWIEPEQKKLVPRYDQKSFDSASKHGVLKLTGSRDGRDGSVVIYADVDLYASQPGKDKLLQHDLGQTRRGWIQLATGQIEVNGAALSAGDGAAFEPGTSISIIGRSDDAEFLLFDMAA